MINVGRLNKRVTFMKQEQTIGELKQRKIELKEYKTVWATVKELRGGEYWDAKRVRPDAVYKITCRYLDNISLEMQIKYHGRLFDITDVNNINESNEYLEIQVVEHKFTRDGDLYGVG
jgi:SPP1 family predicted phage head-tail adaptor